MAAAFRPWRSVLYIPASRPRARVNARTLACDAIIFDLEDAVAPEEKPAARTALAAWLASADYGARARLVRINALDTPWGAADCDALAGVAHEGAVEGVLIPKVNGPAEIEAVAARLPAGPLWAMMETPRAMLNAAAIAAHPRLAGLVMGTNDLAKELGIRFRPDRLPLATGLGLCLLAARAHGLTIIDGVFNALHDAAGLAAECAQGRDLGFDGKTLIHPDQIAAANAAFAPSAEELDLARRQIAAFEAAVAAGQGVAVLDGRIVENLHAAAARATLARAAAIAALEVA
jgi:(3S)-malyl-CoA thioesterase